jgi:hypothetical protein
VLPLLVGYLALAALYAWQAWRRETPTIFTDELEYAQLARSVAETGTPARRGEPLGFTSLVPYLSAPAWWIDSMSTAYAVLKYLQVLVMLSAMFPAYGIARLVVSRRWALAAAIGAGAAPALSYAPFLVEEPYAYPAATFALWLIGRAVCRPSARAFILAGVAAVLAALTRSQLVAIVAVFALCVLAVAWRSERMRAWRLTWSRSDWIGFTVLALGGLLLTITVMGQVSNDWALTTAHFKDRIFEFGLWAGGAFVIGLGFLPVVAALAALARPRPQYRDAGTRAWVTLAASSFVVFVTYTAVKGAYLSTVFSSLIVERNLIYLTPIVAAGTALVLERRDPVWWATLVAGALAFWAVTEVPKKLDYPYYEAHGLAILALPSRLWHWSIERIDHATVIGVIVGTAFVVLLAAFRRQAVAARALAVAMGVAALGWSLTTEIYAANGEYQLSRLFSSNLVQPPDWIDKTIGDGTVVLLGQQMNADPTGVWEDEFWNRSITKVWSVDGTAPPPGPVITPDLAASDGTLTPSPETGYALAFNGVELQSPVVKQLGSSILYQLDGPLKLAFNQTGVYSDGWIGAEAAYNRFSVAEDGPGFASVLLSREAFCAGEPSIVTLQIGPVAIGEDKQPALGSVTEERTVDVAPCGNQTVLLRTPNRAWRVEVRSTTFVPAEVDARLSDRRALSVRIEFGFRPND